MKSSIACTSLVALGNLLSVIESFGIAPPTHRLASWACVSSDSRHFHLFSSEGDSSEPTTKEEESEMVVSLVADDEWEGLGMELTELVRVSIIEDVKKNARDFLGKDDYMVGDISKEIDSRV